MKSETVLSFVCASVFALGVSGCGGDPEPIVTETPSPSASATVDPSPSATPSPSGNGELTDEELVELLPEEALLDDIRGAEATALFFLEQYAKMYQTGDTYLWEELSGDDCVFCASALEGSTTLHADGMSVRGGDVVPRDDSVSSQMNDEGVVYVTLDGTSEDGFTIYEDGSEELTAPGRSVEVLMELHHIDGDWLIDEVQIDER